MHARLGKDLHARGVGEKDAQNIAKKKIQSISSQYQSCTIGQISKFKNGDEKGEGDAHKETEV